MAGYFRYENSMNEKLFNMLPVLPEPATNIKCLAKRLGVKPE